MSKFVTKLFLSICLIYQCSSKTIKSVIITIPQLFPMINAVRPQPHNWSLWQRRCRWPGWTWRPIFVTCHERPNASSIRHKLKIHPAIRVYANYRSKEIDASDRGCNFARFVVVYITLVVKCSREDNDIVVSGTCTRQPVCGEAVSLPGFTGVAFSFWNIEDGT